MKIRTLTFVDYGGQFFSTICYMYASILRTRSILCITVNNYIVVAHFIFSCIAGPPVKVGVSMQIVSISAVSEVQMVIGGNGGRPFHFSLYGNCRNKTQGLIVSLIYLCIRSNKPALTNYRSMVFYKK